jgi:hypothetical protein
MESMNDMFMVLYLMLMIAAAIAGVILIIKTAAKNRKPGLLAGLAFVLAMAGILLGQDRWIGFGLLLLAIVMAIFETRRIGQLKKRK